MQTRESRGNPALLSTNASCPPEQSGLNWSCIRNRGETGCGHDPAEQADRLCHRRAERDGASGRRGPHRRPSCRPHRRSRPHSRQADEGNDACRAHHLAAGCRRRLCAEPAGRCNLHRGNHHGARRSHRADRLRRRRRQPVRGGATLPHARRLGKGEPRHPRCAGGGVAGRHDGPDHLPGSRSRNELHSRPAGPPCALNGAHRTAFLRRTRQSHGRPTGNRRAGPRRHGAEVQVRLHDRHRGRRRAEGPERGHRPLHLRQEGGAGVAAGMAP
ncbi:hypothetical protein Lal_00013815 [Lupinus albus]|nr:hypothetical protein Lal_00013815 [Lupinus albus]